MSNYFLAAALANGDLRRFTELVKNIKAPLLFLHFLLLCSMLYLPLMHALARLSPWDVFERLNAESLTGLVAEEFNQGMYQAGYSVKILLPILVLVYLILLVLNGAFFLLAAFFLGLNRWQSSAIIFRDRMGIFIMSSTIPVAASSVFGFFIPTVHIIVFYLAEILLGFFIARRVESNVE